MSHELRTPLNAIMGLAQLFSYDKKLSAEQKINAMQIYNAGEHLLQLVNDILDLSKIEAGKLELSMEAVSMEAVLDDCRILMAPLAEAEGVAIEFDMESCKEGFIHANYIRTKQVLLNLLTNAIKYNKQNGSVTARCEGVDTDRLRISVSDTGIGIEEHKMAGLFDPFNRLDAELSAIEGTGIGLVISRQLVEMMDGSISVDSSPGKGSTFSVEFRRFSEDGIGKNAGHEKIHSQPVVSVEDKHHGRILAAEDDVVNQRVLCKQLEVLGYEGDMVADGEEAWNRWQSGDYALLLTDINMPHLDGYQLVGRIRQAEAGTGMHVPAIAITANAMEGEIERCLAAGVDGYVSKPINMNDLKRVLEKWMPQDDDEVAGAGEVVAGGRERPDSSVTDVVDLAALSKVVGDDTTVHRDLLDIFIQTSPEIIESIRQASKDRSAQGVVSHAHKLKSSSRAIGAYTLAETCQALEAAGKSGQWDGIDALEPQVGRLFKEVEVFVTNYRAEENREEKSQAAGSVDFGGLKVLIVDDDHMMLHLLQAGLNELGIHKAALESSADRALEILDGSVDRFNTILCDLNMPGMDGLEFIRHLCERKYTGGIVLMSGEDKRILKSARNVARAHNLNILGILEKPVTTASMAAVLEHYYDAVQRTGGRRLEPVTVTAEELRQAIKNDELVVYFQPKVAIDGQQVVGAETLVRWQHPQKGLLPPYLFVSLAEENGLIDDLTMAVFRAAMQCSARWLAAGHDIKVAVNMSVDSLHNLDWPEYVVREADRAGVKPGNVVLELTESRVMEDMAAALEILTRLSLKKFILSVDDFGTGYSSLEQLQRAPFTELKIDRSFVNGAADDPSARAILKASIELAGRLNMSVVAEGVETREDWDLVAGLGCDVVQGYFVARPMPGKEFETWLAEWKGVLPEAVSL